MYAGVGSGGRFRKVPEGSERLVPEGLGRFRRVLESSGACWCRFRREPPKSSGACWCRFWRHGSEGCGEFRCGLLPWNLDRSSRVIVLNTFGDHIVHMGKTTAQKGAYVVKDGIRMHI